MMLLKGIVWHQLRFSTVIANGYIAQWLGLWHKQTHTHSCTDMAVETNTHTQRCFRMRSRSQCWTEERINRALSVCTPLASLPHFLCLLKSLHLSLPRSLSPSSPHQRYSYSMSSGHLETQTSVTSPQKEKKKKKTLPQMHGNAGTSLPRVPSLRCAVKLSAPCECVWTSPGGCCSFCCGRSVTGDFNSLAPREH